MLKDAATIITKPLAYIINLSLQSGSVPMEWKAAKIIPLFKSGSMVELDNYRPISILPVLSKILERIVYKQLLSHLENNGLLSSLQFGFRSKGSTELAVTYFTDKIRKEVDNENIVGAVFIDLSKAFDTVSHSCLLNKLPSYGINDKELHWFTDYLFLERNQSNSKVLCQMPIPYFLEFHKEVYWVRYCLLSILMMCIRLFSQPQSSLMRMIQ